MFHCIKEDSRSLRWSVTSFYLFLFVFIGRTACYLNESLDNMNSCRSGGAVGNASDSGTRGRGFEPQLIQARLDSHFFLLRQHFSIFFSFWICFKKFRKLWTNIELFSQSHFFFASVSIVVVDIKNSNIYYYIKHWFLIWLCVQKLREKGDLPDPD